MKKLSLISTLSLLTVLVAIVACNKKEKDNKSNSTSNDPRNAYVGKYQVKKIINCYGILAPCHYEADTVIEVTLGLTDSTLNVLGRDVKLDVHNNYYAYHYGLYLTSDSINSTSMNGGLGGGKNEYYIGSKKQQ